MPWKAQTLSMLGAQHSGMWLWNMTSGNLMYNLYTFRNNLCGNPAIRPLSWVASPGGGLLSSPSQSHTFLQAVLKSICVPWFQVKGLFYAFMAFASNKYRSLACGKTALPPTSLGSVRIGPYQALCCCGSSHHLPSPAGAPALFSPLTVRWSDFCDSHARLQLLRTWAKSVLLTTVSPGLSQRVTHGSICEGKEEMPLCWGIFWVTYIYPF